MHICKCLTLLSEKCIICVFIYGLFHVLSILYYVFYLIFYIITLNNLQHSVPLFFIDFIFIILLKLNHIKINR